MKQAARLAAATMRSSVTDHLRCRAGEGLEYCAIDVRRRQAKVWAASFLAKKVPLGGLAIGQVARCLATAYCQRYCGESATFNVSVSPVLTSIVRVNV